MTTIMLCVILFSICTYVHATEAEVQQTQEEAEVEQKTTEGNVTIKPVSTSEKMQVKAKVINAGKSYVKDEAEGIQRTLQDVTIEIKEGKYKGQKIDTVYVMTYDVENKIVGYELSKGNTVIVQLSTEGDTIIETTIQEIVRQNYIILMVIVFFAIILLIGKKQGVKAILGLIVTVLAIYFIMIKGIYEGKDAIWLSVITSVVIIVLTFIIIAGINKKSLTAALGTSGGVISSGIMATIFGFWAKISGVTEESLFLAVASNNITFNFRELFFAGIVISALGACMDVGMSIASSLDEIRQKNPDITWKELLKSGMNIGRDVIGTMTNTLILAYVGGALTLILLFMTSNMSIGEIINKETIATEVISALAGSMGVVFTVPITSLIYSLLNRNKTIYSSKAKNIVEGKRSLKL